MQQPLDIKNQIPVSGISHVSSFNSGFIVATEKMEVYQGSVVEQKEEGFDQLIVPSNYKPEKVKIENFTGPISFPLKDA